MGLEGVAEAEGKRDRRSRTTSRSPRGGARGRKGGEKGEKGKGAGHVDQDMGASGSGGGSDGPRGAGGRRSENDGVDELTLMLSLATMVAKHESYLVRTFMIPIESSVSNRVIDAEERYKKKVHGKKGHGLGKPDVYVFACLMEETNTIAKDSKNEWKEETDATEAYFDKYPYNDGLFGDGKQRVSHMVHKCRANETYKKDKVRISLRISDAGLADPIVGPATRAMISVMMKLDGVAETDGPPPKTQKERNIQHRLDKMYKQKTV